MARQKDDRKERIPLGVPRQNLKVDSRFKQPGKVYRWINDEKDRLSAAVAGSYEFVVDPNKEIKVGDTDIKNESKGMDSRVSKVVGETKSGPLTAYLMCIDEGLYKADQEAKQAKIDEMESSIKRGEKSDGTKNEKSYIPSDGIKIKHTKQ